MIAWYSKLWLFAKSAWKAALGISAELILVYLFIFTGFLVCIVWWSVSLLY